MIRSIIWAGMVQCCRKERVKSEYLPWFGWWMGKAVGEVEEGFARRYQKVCIKTATAKPKKMVRLSSSPGGETPRVP